MLYGVDHIDPDEPCWSLSEYDEQSGIPGRGVRRYRRVKVVRNGKITDLKQEIGASGRHPFVIPGGLRTTNGHYTFLHTVGELLDIAEEINAKPRNITEVARDDAMRIAAAKKGRKSWRKP